MKITCHLLALSFVALCFITQINAMKRKQTESTETFQCINSKKAKTNEEKPLTDIEFHCFDTTFCVDISPAVKSFFKNFLEYEESNRSYVIRIHKKIRAQTIFYLVFWLDFMTTYSEGTNGKNPDILNSALTLTLQSNPSSAELLRQELPTLKKAAFILGLNELYNFFNEIKESHSMSSHSTLQ